jgi:hypothetical protein
MEGKGGNELRDKNKGISGGGGNSVDGGKVGGGGRSGKSVNIDNGLSKCEGMEGGGGKTFDVITDVFSTGFSSEEITFRSTDTFFGLKTAFPICFLDTLKEVLNFTFAITFGVGDALSGNDCCSK